MAELIRRQRVPLRIASRERPTARGPLPGQTGEAAHQAPPRQSNRTARVAALTTGALVLLVSVAAASILVATRDSGPARPSVTPPADITGSSALRPDVLAAELTGPQDSEPAPLGPDPMAADVPMDVPAEPEGPVVPPREAATRSKPQVDVVRHFYELLPAKPAEAALLLTGDLIGTGARDFVASWGGIQAITIESTTLRADGTVRAVVSMQERSGRWMRVEQRFWLTDTSPPRISGTEVLSAQRS
ncbi:hypothetical protein AB0I60_18190 [Actinosynnema sp. NPDC050436]|uniref:hypothetical protein n=1 Tax=Actinosynnema sp. NPDC050436 TaxID=3155659 RepID=UPI00340D70F4